MPGRQRLGPRQGLGCGVPRLRFVAVHGQEHGLTARAGGEVRGAPSRQGRKHLHEEGRGAPKAGGGAAMRGPTPDRGDRGVEPANPREAVTVERECGLSGLVLVLSGDQHRRLPWWQLGATLLEPGERHVPASLNVARPEGLLVAHVDQDQLAEPRDRCGRIERLRRHRLWRRVLRRRVGLRHRVGPRGCAGLRHRARLHRILTR